MSTRGASECVLKTPTGFPDWISNVSSSSRLIKLFTIASKDSQFLAAFPIPP